VGHSALPLFLLVGLAGCGAQATPGSVAPPAAAGSSQTDPPTADRQIIYRATLVLHVEDFAAAEKRIAELIKTTGGYVAQFREDRPYGSHRGGHWTVRVPVPQFDRFLDEVGRLGVAQQRERHADDVTEEYVDLAARLKNKQQLETRLLELVAKRTDEIKDVIAVEAELSRVREEIERMQGRLRYLTDRVALTTIEITAYERRDYRPPEATLAGRIAFTFWQSLDLMRLMVEGCLLVLVGILPWLVAFLLMVFPVAWLARRPKRPSATIVQAQAM
jgi:hypothetical protein